MTVAELRQKYIEIVGVDGDMKKMSKFPKPELKAVILMHEVGVPVDLHTHLLDDVVKLNNLRFEHLQAQAFHKAKMSPTNLSRQELVKGIIRALWEKKNKKDKEKAGGQKHS